MSGIAGNIPERRLIVVSPNEMRNPIQKTQLTGRRPPLCADSPWTISNGTWASGKARRSCDIHWRRSSRIRQSVAVNRASIYEPQAAAGAAHGCHGTEDLPWK